MPNELEQATQLALQAWLNPSQMATDEAVKIAAQLAATNVANNAVAIPVDFQNNLAVDTALQAPILTDFQQFDIGQQEIAPPIVLPETGPIETTSALPAFFNDLRQLPAIIWTQITTEIAPAIDNSWFLKGLLLAPLWILTWWLWLAAIKWDSDRPELKYDINKRISWSDLFKWRTAIESYQWDVDRQLSSLNQQFKWVKEFKSIDEFNNLYKDYFDYYSFVDESKIRKDNKAWNYWLPQWIIDNYTKSNENAKSNASKAIKNELLSIENPKLSSQERSYRIATISDWFMQDVNQILDRQENINLLAEKDARAWGTNVKKIANTVNELVPWIIDRYKESYKVYNEAEAKWLDWDDAVTQLWKSKWFTSYNSYLNNTTDVNGLLNPEDRLTALASTSVILNKWSSLFSKAAALTQWLGTFINQIPKAIQWAFLPNSASSDTNLWFQDLSWWWVSWIESNLKRAVENTPEILFWLYWVSKLSTASKITKFSQPVNVIANAAKRLWESAAINTYIDSILPTSEQWTSRYLWSRLFWLLFDFDVLWAFWNVIWWGLWWIDNVIWRSLWWLADKQAALANKYGVDVIKEAALNQEKKKIVNEYIRNNWWLPTNQVDIDSLSKSLKEAKIPTNVDINAIAKNIDNAEALLAFKRTNDPVAFAEYQNMAKEWLAKAQMWTELVKLLESWIATTKEWQDYINNFVNSITPFIKNDNYTIADAIQWISWWTNFTYWWFIKSDNVVDKQLNVSQDLIPDNVLSVIPSYKSGDIISQAQADELFPISKEWNIKQVEWWYKITKKWETELWVWSIRIDDKVSDVPEYMRSLTDSRWRRLFSDSRIERLWKYFDIIDNALSKIIC